MSYRDDAKASKSAKISRMIGSKSDAADKVEAAEGVSTTTAKSDVPPSAGSDGGKMSKARGDRPARARGGAVKGKGKATTVNVIVAPQSGGQPGASVSAMPPGAGPGAGPMPPPPSAAPAPAMPPRPPMPAPGGAAIPMRKRGGAVKLTGGAGGGTGRLEKAEAY